LCEKGTAVTRSQSSRWTPDKVGFIPHQRKGSSDALYWRNGFGDHPQMGEATLGKAA
jgi:hypothetical protein